MTPERMLAELESLAARLGIAVRPEPFGRGVLEGRGGLCWVDGKPLVVMDASLGVVDRIGVLAKALSQFDLSDLTLAPEVGARIDKAREPPREPRKPRTGKRPWPGLARIRPKGR